MFQFPVARIPVKIVVGEIDSYENEIHRFYPVYSFLTAPHFSKYPFHFIRSFPPSTIFNPSPFSQISIQFFTS